MSSRDPDPDRLLEGRLDARKAPVWVDSKTCHHCTDKLKLGKRHHCRLCGHEFCSSCTWKYHVPERFQRKSKHGPARVCFGCRDEVLASHRLYDRAIEVPRPRLVAKVRGERLYIYPPQWADEDEYSDCKQCHLQRGRHPYFCRICGEMFCSDCTFKDMVPDAFRQKMYKQGPVRICFECRWKITGGAILVDDRNAIIPAEQEVFRVARPSPKLKQSRTASSAQLFNAVLHGSREELEQILKSPTIDVNGFDAQNMTPLMHCARKGMPEKMRALITQCSNSLIIDYRNKNGMSALMYAALEDRREEISILLSQPRCNVNLSTLSGYTALMLAADTGHWKVVSFLIGTESIDCNYRNKRGNTALMLAASQGHSKAVDELLKGNRIDVDGENVEGKRAIDLATDNGHEGCRSAIYKASIAQRKETFKKLFRIHLRIPDSEALSLAARFIQVGIEINLENLTMGHIKGFDVSTEVKEKLKDLMLVSHTRKRGRMDSVIVSRRISALDLDALPLQAKRPSHISTLSRNGVPFGSASCDIALRPPAAGVRTNLLRRAITTAEEPFGGAMSQTRIIASSSSASKMSFLSSDFSSGSSLSLSHLGGRIDTMLSPRAFGAPTTGADPISDDENEHRNPEYERFLADITKDGFIRTENYRKLLHKYARVDTATHSNALAALRLRPRAFDQMIVKGRDPETVFHPEEDNAGQALRIMAAGGLGPRDDEAGSLVDWEDALPDLPPPEIHNCTREVIAFRIGSPFSNGNNDAAKNESSSLSFKEGEIIGPLARRPLKCSEKSIRVSLSAFVGCSIYYLSNIELSRGDVYRIAQNDVELRNLFSEGKASALLFRQARKLLGLAGNTSSFDSNA